MIKTFTKNDLIRFVYNEVNAEERDEMEMLLIHDHSFLQLYRKYNGMKKTIQKVSMEPSENVINRILNYSKSFSLHQ